MLDTLESPLRAKAILAEAGSINKGEATTNGMTTSTSTMWLRRVHLDEQFCQQMDERLGRRHHEKLLEDEFSEKYHLEIKNKLTHSLLAHLLIFYGRFCRVHIQSGCWKLSAVDSNEEDKSNNNENKIGNNNNRNLKSQLFEWPNMVAILYCMSTALISVGLYYHYVHDQFVFHLRRFSQAQEMGQYILMADYANSNVTREKLLRRVNETRPLVKSFGAPYLEATYATECVYLYVLMAANVTYLNTWIYDRFVRGFNFYVVNKYLQSSCNFTEAFINRCIQLNGLRRFKLEQLNNRSELRKLLLDYKSTIRSLKQMALEGSLQPINRTDAWIDWLTQLFCWACLAVKSIPVVVYVLAFIVVPVRYFNFRLQLDLMDLVAAAGLTVLSIVVALSGGFYVSLTIVNCLDQTNMIELLIREIKKCVDDNTKAFRDNFTARDDKEEEEDDDDDEDYNTEARKSVVSRISAASIWKHRGEEKIQQQVVVETKSPAAATINRLVSEMNNRLLFVFVHYKIFVAQLRPIQSSFGFICMTSLFVIFLIPLIGRLHLPYVTTNIKLMIIAMGMATLVIGNACIAPVCHLHLKCLKLYKCLCCLLAHSVDVATSSAESNVRIYDKHTIWMLRKELNHPDRLANQFATKAFGLSFVYPNLIRINFWFSLIILSILTDARSDQEEVIGSLTSDPLGIFTLNGMDNY